MAGGTPYSKRYSREFEDVSPFLFTSSNSSSSSSSSIQQLRSARSKTRSPSLEELLEEVEKESRGPDYRYVPPPLSDSDNDTGSVSCHPLNRLSNSSSPSPSPNNSYNFFKAPNLTPPSRAGHYSPSPLLKSPQQSKDALYDFLSPQGFLKPRSPKTAVISEQEKRDDDYVCLRPSSEYQKRSLARNDKSTYSVPLLTDEVLSHTYEYLPPLPKEKARKEEEEGFESYIEMAPLTDAKLKMSPKKVPASPLKFSPAKKGEKQVLTKLTKLVV